jgi:integrase
MARIFRRTRRGSQAGTWYARFYVKGRRLVRCLHTNARREAEHVAQALEAEYRTGVRFQQPENSRVRIAELVEDFLAWRKAKGKGYKNWMGDVSRMRNIFGPITPTLKLDEKRTGGIVSEGEKKPKGKKYRMRTGKPLKAEFLEQLTTADLNRFFETKMRAGMAPATHLRYREILHTLYEYAIKFKGYISPDPRHPNLVKTVERVKIPAPEIRFLTLDQIHDQLEALNEHSVLRVMVATCIYAGLRREELCWLTHQDFDLAEGMIRVRAKTEDGEFWQPKTKVNRAVPISTALRTALVTYRPPRRGVWFFPSPDGCRWDPDNFSHHLADVNREKKKPWTCLDFRHTFGSHLAKRGESLYKISKLMGNSPEICRRHYAALVPEEMRDSVEFDVPKAAAGEVIQIQQVRQASGG